MDFGEKEEKEAIEKWVSEHYETCPITNAGAIGGRFTYHFTPTSIGTVCRVSCSCGAEYDATRYDWW